MDTATWIPIAILGAVAALALAAAGLMNLAGLRGLAEWVEWGLGLVALACALAAGPYVRQTFIGQQIVPGLLGLGTVVVVLGVVGLLALLVYAFAAMLPGRLSPVAAGAVICLGLALAPSVIPVLPHQYKAVVTLHRLDDAATRYAMQFAHRYLV